jgi:hypothetical protein
MKTKTMRTAASFTALLLLMITFCVGSVQAAPDKSQKMADERFERRAVEAAYWGMPAVNTWAMREGLKRDVGAGYNAVTYFSKPMDWKLQVTTPNNSTLYIFSFWNTKRDGPIVVEVPPTTKDVGLFGAVMDMWQRPLLDVGDNGADRGLGAKYLFLPPGYQDIPPKGYIPVKSDTYNGWFLLRTLLKDFSSENLQKGEDWIKQFKVYPLSQAIKPPATKFVDGHDKLIEAIAPYDDTFFDALNTMVQEEPVAEQDLVAMGMLQTLGMEKGKLFKPTKKQREMLKSAAKDAQEEFMDAAVKVVAPYWPDSKWSYLVSAAVIQQTEFTFKYPRLFDYTTRANLYYTVFSSVKHLGAATQYLISGKDASGVNLDGGSNYKLTLPANVPVKQFWSALVYDLSTAGFVKNTPKAGVTSLDKGLKTNSDGSVDVYFGPKPPAGKDANWAPTVAGHDYFLLFRFYGPSETFFDKSWKLGDLKKVK